MQPLFDSMIFFHKHCSDYHAPSDFSEHTNPQQDYGRIFTELVSVKIRKDKQGNGDEHMKKG